jgi:hypothetical protein
VALEWQREAANLRFSLFGMSWIKVTWPEFAETMLTIGKRHAPDGLVPRNLEIRPFILRISLVVKWWGSARQLRQQCSDAGPSSFAERSGAVNYRESGSARIESKMEGVPPGKVAHG